MKCCVNKLLLNSLLGVPPNIIPPDNPELYLTQFVYISQSADYYGNSFYQAIKVDGIQFPDPIGGNYPFDDPTGVYNQIISDMSSLGYTHLVDYWLTVSINWTNDPADGESPIYISIFHPQDLVISVLVLDDVLAQQIDGIKTGPHPPNSNLSGDITAFGPVTSTSVITEIVESTTAGIFPILVETPQVGNITATRIKQFFDAHNKSSLTVNLTGDTFSISDTPFLLNTITTADGFFVIT